MEWNAVEISKKSGMATGDVYKSTWEFYEDLRFLVPTLLVREGIDSSSGAAHPLSSSSSSASSDVVRDQENKEKFINKRKRKSTTTVPPPIPPVQKEIVENMQAASNALSAIMARQPDNSVPEDIRGFLISLGADLSTIDLQIRKYLMHDMRSMVVKTMFPPPAQARQFDYTNL